MSRALTSCLVKDHPSPTAKTSRPPPMELPARHQIRPLRQGDLDCLCGVYAAINAARLLLAEHGEPMSGGKCVSVVTAATRRIADKRGLHNAFALGLDPRRRLAITRHVAHLVSTERFRVSVERPDTRRWILTDAVAWIEQSLTGHRPVLVRLIGPALDHYTVIAAATPRTLQLFDSGPQRYLRKDSIGLRTGTNVIPASSIMRLALEPAG
jgi:hypothetical protein